MTMLMVSPSMLLTLRQSCLAIGATLMSLLMPTGSARAQGAPLSLGVSGSVVSEPEGVPIASAVVTLKGVSRIAITDSMGVFRLLGMPSGIYQLTVQHIGFGPATATVTLDTFRMLEVEISLPRSPPQTLAEVRVVATARPLGKLVAFEQRRLSGSPGVFLQQAALEAETGRQLADVVRSRLTSARIILYGRTGAELIASGRGVGSITQQPRADPADINSPTACFAQVYLDGVRIYAPSVSSPIGPPDLRRMRPETLMALEFYSGSAATPAEFGGLEASCGTLVLWTRDK